MNAVKSIQIKSGNHQERREKMRFFLLRPMYAYRYLWNYLCNETFSNEEKKNCRKMPKFHNYHYFIRFASERFIDLNLKRKKPKL